MEWMRWFLSFWNFYFMIEHFEKLQLKLPIGYLMEWFDPIFHRKNLCLLTEVQGISNWKNCSGEKSSWFFLIFKFHLQISKWWGNNESDFSDVENTKARSTIYNNAAHRIQPSKWKIEHGRIWALHAITHSSWFLREISSFIWLKGEMNEMDLRIVDVLLVFVISQHYENWKPFGGCKPLLSIFLYFIICMLWRDIIMEYWTIIVVFARLAHLYSHLDYYFKGVFLRCFD